MPTEVMEDVVEEAPAIDDNARSAYYYEEKRDHALQESVNAGQSGYALPLILQGSRPLAVVQSQSYNRGVRRAQKPGEDLLPEDQLVVEQTAELAVKAAPEAEEPASIVTKEYEERLKGASDFLALARQLSGSPKRQRVVSGASYGRRKRQLETVTTAEDEAVLTNALLSRGQEEPAPIVTKEYEERLKGASDFLALARQLSGSPGRQRVVSGASYGRRKRQVEALTTAEDEAVLANAAVSRGQEEPAPIVTKEYEERLMGASDFLALARQLSGSPGRQRVVSGSSYGRKRRQVEGNAIMIQFLEPPAI